MRYKVHFHGLEIECDTVADVVALSRADGNEPRTVQGKSKPVHKSSRIMNGEIFKRNGKTFMETLKQAYPNSVNTEILAALIGMHSKAIPAIVMGMRRSTKHANLDFDALVKRETVIENGKQTSTYAMTAEGLRVFQEQLREGNN